MIISKWNMLFRRLVFNTPEVSLAFTYTELKPFILPENKTKRELIRMLVQRGYESDPVAAWTKAQEKVHDTHIKDAPLCQNNVIDKAIT